MAAEPPPNVPARPRPFVVRDPMFMDIALTREERDVLDSDIFQRQRGVKQLGTSLLLYPSAVQTRFVHALGNLRIAGEMVSHALESDPALTREYLEAARAWLMDVTADEDQRRAIGATDTTDIERRIKQVARIAGMCHDLGHFPMGHVLEDALSHREIVGELLKPSEVGEWGEWVTLRGAAVHEYATIQLLANNGGGQFDGRTAERARPFRPENDWLRRAVLAVIQATHVGKDAPPPHPIARSLAELISDEIDSDRAEYLRRDSVVSGAGYGQYDIDRLVQSYTLARDGGRFVFRPATRALAAVQTFLHERVKAYGHLYYHNLGFLMDALLGSVLRSLYRPSEVDRLRAELSASDQAALDEVRKALPLSRLHYDNFDDPHGYVDDATLWEFLRKVLAWLEGLVLGDGQMELRRVRTYLRALLRRRHVWVSLWKDLDGFKRVSDAAFDEFATMVQRTHPTIGKGEIRHAIAIMLTRRTRSKTPTARASVLNFIAHEFRGEERLGQLARVLEKRLRASPPAWLEGALFVDVGERAKFKPLKTPGAYQLVDAGGRLRRLGDVARASVDAIVAWWFEGYPQLRMYVITERELSEEQRDGLRGIACAELPAALAEWYASMPQEFDPGKVLASESDRE